MTATETTHPQANTAAVTAERTTPDRRAALVIASVEIDRPAPMVWDAIADYSFDLQWRLGITEMTPDPAGPPRNGTRIREVLRSSGMTFTTNAVVSDVVPGISYRFAGAGTTGDVRGMRLVEPLSQAATRFTYQVELRPTRHYRFLRRILKGALEAGLRKDLQRLKTLLEGATQQ